MFNAETLEKFYEAAYRIFQRQEFEKAADAFFFLVATNPSEHRFWCCLGLCEQLRQRYRQAIEAHGMAIITNVDNPYPHFHSALCYRELGQYQDALAALELAIEYAGDKYESLTADAKILKAEFLKNLY